MGVEKSDSRQPDWASRTGNLLRVNNATVLLVAIFIPVDWTGVLRPVHTRQLYQGNKVAENGNKLLPFAEIFGVKVFAFPQIPPKWGIAGGMVGTAWNYSRRATNAESLTALRRNVFAESRKTATICYRYGNFVAWYGHLDRPLLFIAKWTQVRVYDPGTFSNSSMRFCASRGAAVQFGANNSTPIHQLELKWRPLQTQISLLYGPPGLICAERASKSSEHGGALALVRHWLMEYMRLVQQTIVSDCTFFLRVQTARTC